MIVHMLHDDVIYTSGGTCARISANADAQSDDDDDNPASVLKISLAVRWVYVRTRPAIRMG